MLLNGFAAAGGTAVVSRDALSGIPCIFFSLLEILFTAKRYEVRKRTFNKYSTALSGLLNAALIARSISALGNPIDSISAIAAVRALPVAKAFGSLNPGLSVFDVAVPCAGVGVAKILLEAPPPVAGAGAAGVVATLVAGVEGSFVGVEDSAAVAGTGFG